jgi:hypothetical protein
MKPQDNKSSRPGRIPAALQAIFLASNGGAEVDVPPRNMGFKVFSRILGGKNKKQVYNKRKKSVQVSAPVNEEVRQTISFPRSLDFNLSRNSLDPFLNSALNGAS